MPNYKIFHPSTAKSKGGGGVESTLPGCEMGSKDQAFLGLKCMRYLHLHICYNSLKGFFFYLLLHVYSYISSSLYGYSMKVIFLPWPYFKINNVNVYQCINNSHIILMFKIYKKYSSKYHLLIHLLFYKEYSMITEKCTSKHSYKGTKCI